MRVSSVLDRVAGLGSDKWRVHMRARQMLDRGEALILLTIGEPDQPTPAELVAATHHALLQGRTGYSSGRGEAPVLQALAARYSARTGRVVGRDQFIWVPGTQTALYLLLMALVEAGDEVLVADPCYATYHGLVRATGALAVPVALRESHGFRLQADDLARAVTPRTRLIFLNSPHNPTGAVLTQGDIRAIGELARAQDLWILSDEVYESLVYGGRGFVSPFDLPELADRTVVASSLSKSHAAPGFRAGWCVGSPAFIQRLLPLAETMLFGAQPFIADMATLALSREFEITAQMCNTYAARAGRVAAALAAVPGLRVHPPQAGMFVMVSVDGLGVDGQAFAERLLDEERVAVMPGAAFGDAAAGMVRLSLTVPDAALDEGCRRLAVLAQRVAAAR